MEQKEVEISTKISKKDASKKFIISQIAATKMKKLLFEYQNVFSYGTSGEITVNATKKEELYYKILEEIDCKVTKGGSTSFKIVGINEIIYLMMLIHQASVLSYSHQIYELVAKPIIGIGYMQ